MTVETKPALFLIAEEMLNHAKYVYGDGDYRWLCGDGVRRLAFESAVVVSSKPITPEELRVMTTDRDFTFCGLAADVSRYLPSGRLELYRWVDFRNTRIALMEFSI